MNVCVRVCSFDKISIGLQFSRKLGIGQQGHVLGYFSVRDIKGSNCLISIDISIKKGFLCTV